MRITYKSIRNTKQADKPNEDAILCDVKENIYILLDGVSRDNENGKYPNPSPAIEVVKILKEEIYKYIKCYQKQYDDILLCIYNSVKNANNKVQEYNKQVKLSFAAGAVGIVVVISSNTLFFAYIGDCYGRVIYKDRVSLFTKCQTKLINEHKSEYTTYEIRQIICNNIIHPYAYGVLNGDSNAMEFVKCGELELTEVEQVILSSDGMEQFLINCSVEMMKRKDADELLNGAIQYNNDNQDDRTIIKIEKDI